MNQQSNNSMAPKSPLKIGIYYRVSTNVQEKKSQEADINSWIDNQDNVLSVKTYTDKASGACSYRPGYTALLNDAFCHTINTIVVYKLDRFSRVCSEAIVRILELDKRGVSFISVTQPLLSSTNSFWRISLAIFSELAEMERLAIGERVKAGLAAAKANGKVLGAKRTINREQVIQMCTEGFSQRHIARTLRVSSSSVNRILRESRTRR